MKTPYYVIQVILALPLLLAPATQAADGYGANTTGGQGGAVVTPGNAAEFKSFVETVDTPYIVQVSGVIDLGEVGGRVSIRSNKTIRGLTPNATVIGQLGFKKYSSNVIFERLNITNPNDYGEGDGISLKEDIENVFITKCTFYDCPDGCLDITRRSDQITVSWCKFYFTAEHSDKSRVSLIGSSDDATDDLGKLHITIHHNWFGDGCWQRMPSVRYGRVHLYNNYYDCPGNLYGVRSRVHAECRIENNYFEGINNPYYVYIADPGEVIGKISASGNVFVDCKGQIDDGDDLIFRLLYLYEMDDADDVPAIVRYGAGADGADFIPHWLSGPYGDFNLDGVVDSDDLGRYADCWLAEKVEDADYNGDGTVNGVEFALFAEDWHKGSENPYPRREAAHQ